MKVLILPLYTLVALHTSIHAAPTLAKRGELVWYTPVRSLLLFCPSQNLNEAHDVVRD